jgi:hypothetical protein
MTVEQTKQGWVVIDGDSVHGPFKTNAEVRR